MSTVPAGSTDWDANAAFSLVRGQSGELRALIGFRQVNLTEDVRITSSSRSLDPVTSGPSYLGQPLPTDQTESTFDLFRARTNFYGPQFGFRGDWAADRFAFGLGFKAAFGVVRETVSIAGATTAFDAAGRVVGTTPAGVYALASNSGDFSRGRFGFVPEVNATVSFRIVDGLKARGRVHAAVPERSGPAGVGHRQPPRPVPASPATRRSVPRRPGCCRNLRRGRAVSGCRA